MQRTFLLFWFTFLDFRFCSAIIEKIILVSIAVFKILVFLFPSPFLCCYFYTLLATLDVSLNWFFLCWEYQCLCTLMLCYTGFQHFFPCSCFSFGKKLTFPDLLFLAHIYFIIYFEERDMFISLQLPSVSFKFLFI